MNYLEILFVGYYPHKKPKYGFCEHGGSGSKVRRKYVID